MRKVEIEAQIGSDRETTLHTLFEQSRYKAPRISYTRLRGAVLDAGDTGVVLRRDGQVARPSQVVAGYYTDVSDPAVMETLAAQATQTFTDKALHVFHRSCSAYGHFILDGLNAICLFWPLIEKHGLRIVVPDYLPDWAFGALVEFGVPETSLLPIEDVALLEDLFLPSTLSMSNCFFPSPRSIAALRTRAKVPKTRTKGRRFYLSREGAYSPRFVSNEEAVWQLFEAAGFEKLNPASFCLREQIDLFSEASAIAGHHGSAFANMVFAPPRAHVIDMMPEHWVGYWPQDGAPERWLFNLTAACDHDYSVVLSPSQMTGKPVTATGASDLPRIDSQVDLHSLQAVLSRLDAH